jgi:hypothetical protein
MKDIMMKGVKIWLVYYAKYIQSTVWSFDVSIKHFSIVRFKNVAQAMIVTAGTLSIGWIPPVILLVVVEGVYSYNKINFQKLRRGVP